MIRVYIADTLFVERSALRIMLLDLNMEIAGQAGDWKTTLAEMPLSRADMLLVESELLPIASRAALDGLRRACPKAFLIVLIGQLGARPQAALSVGADLFFSKDEMPERISEHLRTAAAKIHQ